MEAISLPTITKLRSDVSRLYTSKARRLVRRAVPDGAGGERWAYEPVNPEYSCNLTSKPTARETIEADRVAAVDLWELHLPYGTPCELSDRWQVNGETFEAQSTNQGRSIQLELVVQVKRAR